MNSFYLYNICFLLIKKEDISTMKYTEEYGLKGVRVFSFWFFKEPMNLSEFSMAFIMLTYQSTPLELMVGCGVFIIH